MAYNIKVIAQLESWSSLALRLFSKIYSSLFSLVNMFVCIDVRPNNVGRYVRSYPGDQYKIIVCAQAGPV